jgi:uncharacterized protein (TIGR02996 family)
VSGGAEVEQALLEAIYDRLDDDAPRAVYADWLTEQGDLRGEFITLQLMPAEARTAKHVQRERFLAAQHRDAIVGPLARVLTGVELERGLPVRGTLQLPDEATWDEVCAWRAWSTIEELDYPEPFKPQLEPWENPVHAAMTSLATVTFPNPYLVLAATQPWPFQQLWLELSSQQFRPLLAGPLLPRLRHLVVRGAFRFAPDPSWLEGVTIGPPQITMLGVGLDDDVPRWLALARPLPLERLSLLAYAGEAGVHAHFTRDATGAFTRLDIELRYVDQRERQWDRDHTARLVAALPHRSLTHLSAHAVHGFRRQFSERPLPTAQRIAIPQIVEAGADVLR